MQKVRKIVKWVVLVTAAAALAWGIFRVVREDDRPVRVGELPEAAQRFLNDNFPGVGVSYARVDEEIFEVEYKVVLVNGAKVEFFRNGRWKEVESLYDRVPEGVVPAAIVASVAELFPAEMIVSIERDRRKYEVQLGNGLELTYDARFRLIDLDD